MRSARARSAGPADRRPPPVPRRSSARRAERSAEPRRSEGRPRGASTAPYCPLLSKSLPSARTSPWVYDVGSCGRRLNDLDTYCSCGRRASDSAPPRPPQAIASRTISARAHVRAASAGVSANSASLGHGPIVVRSIDARGDNWQSTPADRSTTGHEGGLTVKRRTLGLSGFLGLLHGRHHGDQHAGRRRSTSPSSGTCARRAVARTALASSASRSRSRRTASRARTISASWARRSTRMASGWHTLVNYGWNTSETFPNDTDSWYYAENHRFDPDGTPDALVPPDLDARPGLEPELRPARGADHSRTTARPGSSWTALAVGGSGSLNSGLDTRDLDAGSK